MQNIKNHIILTSITLIFTILLFELTPLDINIQDFLYNFNTKQWLLNRSNSFYNTLDLLLYKGLKNILIFFASTILLILVFFYKTKLIQEYKKGLLTIVLCAIFIPSVVISLKTVSNVPCPKNISHYNGTYPDLKAFQSYPDDFVQKEKIRCWPAGHASAGFSLLSLFFLFKTKRKKYIAIYFSLIIGWIMGIYKMIIGDHFISHTIITMEIAWLITLIISVLINFLYKEKNETF